VSQPIDKLDVAVAIHRVLQRADVSQTLTFSERAAMYQFADELACHFVAMGNMQGKTAEVFLCACGVRT
jgi:hypothetical protein